MIEAALRVATGNPLAKITAVAALESCAGTWARGMASAKVTPASGLTATITPTFLAMMGRGLVPRGECLWEITVIDGRLVLLPISHLTVTGGTSTSSWQYQVTANSPDTVETRILPTDAVIHCRIGAEPSTPWQGRPPMATASDTGSLAANLELRLGQEAGGQSAALGRFPKGITPPLPRI